MIFPDVTLAEWLKKYPDLAIKSVICSCGFSLQSTIPFISKNYIGIKTPTCQCGNHKVGVESLISRTSVENNDWLKLIEGEIIK